MAGTAKTGLLDLEKELTCSVSLLEMCTDLVLRQTRLAKLKLLNDN